MNSQCRASEFSTHNLKMPTDEQQKATTRAQTSSRPPTPTLNLPTGTDGTPTPTGVQTRSSSPCGVPSEIVSKAETQLTRLESMRSIKRRLPECAPNTSMGELKVYGQQADELLKAFYKEHANFEVSWPRSQRDHPYYTENYLYQMQELITDVKVQIGRLSEELAPYQPSRSTSTASSLGKLPELALPSFSGDYARWPAYSELFSSLIISRKDLTDIERLQYLLTSLAGEPAQKVEALPLKGASFTPAWELLKETYSNKRLLIQAQLERLFEPKPTNTKAITALKVLVTNLEGAETALSALGVEDLGDSILTHLVARQMDKAAREAWENSVGSQTEYPTFQKIKDFINQRARALERADAPPPQASTSTAPRQGKPTASRASAHTASADLAAKRKSFPCDLCRGDHFIVMCPKFRGMTVAERRKVVASNMLCYNCCGRHSSANCKSPHKCKQCGIQHHTMLHIPDARPAQPPPQTEASQSSTSAQQN